MKEKQPDSRDTKERSKTTHEADRREVSTLIAALTLFGMGLGVNAEEASAGLKQNLGDIVEPGASQQGVVAQPSVDMGKKVNVKQEGILQPSVDLGKKVRVRHEKVEQPSVDLGKKVHVRHEKVVQPSVDLGKKVDVKREAEELILPGEIHD